MPTADAAAPPEPDYQPLAGILSYLVPGLGQISQGRFGKGLLFLVCVYGLFFYGQRLGSKTEPFEGEEYRVGSNVYLPDTMDRNNPVVVPYINWTLPRWMANLYNRPQFAGQFWVGMAAWPAIWQYQHADDDRDRLLRNDIAEQRALGNKDKAEELEQKLRHGNPLFGQYQRAPSEEAINVIQTSGDKLLELGWVYTVIAGVLNIMVIYDALAGPAFVAARAVPPASSPTRDGVVQQASPQA